MKLSFHGAARTVTGSKHIIHISPNKKVLLDCGMFQGMGKDTLRLNSEWGFEPSELTHVIISHAHIDHIGLLPKLVKDGYKGKIFCTTATADLAKILLVDSARIQESDIRFINRMRERDHRPLVEPLYTEEDAEKVFPMLQAVEYDTPYHVDEDIELLYTDCGHIIGSSAVNLKLREQGKETNLTFSGDIGRYGDLILRSPEVFPQADYIIMESTYGDRLHDAMMPATDKLLKQIEHTCLQKKGKLIIPAFSVGRTQEILFLLNRLDLEKRLPKVKYYVDSPLSSHATAVIKNHPECFNDAVKQLLKRDDDVFGFDGLEYTETAEDSKALDASHEPCVIISASGMAEAGRVKHHIAHGIDNPSNTVLIVGYSEPHSLGGKLKNGADRVTIFGVHHEVRAEIRTIDSLSAHGDYHDMEHWLSCQQAADVRKLFLVHGEYEVQVVFREKLLQKGFSDITIPEQHQVVDLGNLD